jgi:hypothetical protein
MAKYDPLRRYLRRRGREVDELVLSFDEIERILGAMLPKAARQEDWWTNEPTHGRGFVQCRAWIEAGFEAHPSVATETVQFRRQRPVVRSIAALLTEIDGRHEPVKASPE